jgi:hypothetical protein
MANPPGVEPAKPPEHNFAGFAGALSVENRIIESAKSSPARPSEGCPYHLPEGVRLVCYTPKRPPIVLTVYSVVAEPDKFIRRALDELDARLHRPVQIKAGDSLFELLSKLADCGLELRLEWPVEPRIIRESQESEPAKPAKLPEPPSWNPHEVEIRDEDVPF